PVAGALAVMLGVTTIWLLNRAKPLTATAGQIALLRAYEPARYDVALEYRPLHRIPVAALPAQLRLGPAVPNLPPPDQPLLTLASPPAGVYRITIGVRPPAAGMLTIDVDPDLPPVLQLPLASADGPVLQREIRLPVVVPDLEIRADPDARRTLNHVWLRPLQKSPATDPVARLVSRHGVLSGSGLLFLIDGTAFVEAGGAWVGGDAQAQFVLAPDTDAPARLVLHNAPVGNDVALQSGAWHLALHLTPGEQREIEIPRLPGTLGTQVGISTSAGFYPYLVSPGSTDHRFLGCWIELR
ncbi:MAG TPA: hypothetical protein VND92_11390, partial [Vicinamibacterales bacterium]|nr:hypothetical protein [Vicinamibacterales bacterium]